MPTPKALYVGSGAGTAPRKGFSDKLKRFLMDAYLRRHAKGRGRPEANGDGEARAEEFASVLLLGAQWAIGAMHSDTYEIPGQALRAELADLRRSLSAAVGKLRKLSPAVDRALASATAGGASGLDADPMTCADDLEKLIGFIDAAVDSKGTRKRSSKLSDRRHAIAVELTARVLPVLKDYGLRVSATAEQGRGRGSDAVLILKQIGDDIGLPFANVTWRDAIIASKKRAAGLKQ
jgi:hypothetical protein